MQVTCSCCEFHPQPPLVASCFSPMFQVLGRVAQICSLLTEMEASSFCACCCCCCFSVLIVVSFLIEVENKHCSALSSPSTATSAFNRPAYLLKVPFLLYLYFPAMIFTGSPSCNTMLLYYFYTNPVAQFSRGALVRAI